MNPGPSSESLEDDEDEDEDEGDDGGEAKLGEIILAAV